MTPTFDGSWTGGLTLDPIAGTIVSDELDRIGRHLYDLDRAAARARLGRVRDPLPNELDRTPAQRRADALVEMAVRSPTPSAAPPPRTTVGTMRLPQPPAETPGP